MRHFISRNSSLVVEGADAVAQVFGQNGELLREEYVGNPARHDKECERLGAPKVELVDDVKFKKELEEVGIPSKFFMDIRRSLTLANFSPSFEWKGDSRWLPNPHTAAGKEILSSCYLPVLATFLAAKMWNIRSSADYVVYGDAAKVNGCESLMNYFGDSHVLQRWCAREGIVDLTAIVVNKSIRQPGGGAYVIDYRNEDEWRMYMAKMKASLRDCV